LKTYLIQSDIYPQNDPSPPEQNNYYPYHLGYRNSPKSNIISWVIMITGLSLHYFQTNCTAIAPFFNNSYVAIGYLTLRYGYQQFVSKPHEKSFNRLVYKL